MENINPISVGVFILMGIKSASLTTLLSIFFSFMVLCWIIELHDDFYFSFLQPTFHFLCSITQKQSAKGTKSNVVVENMLSSIDPPPSSNDEEDYVEVRMGRREVELVMQRLGLFCNPDGDKLQKILGSREISNLFNENEPSLGEVKQAFELFDENNDGYIDETELEKVLCSLGFQEFSEKECQRMIKSYDHNGDGLIDFDEFSELVVDSFS